MTYPLIHADPAWPYRDKSLSRGGAARHYRTAALPEIAEHIETFADPRGCALACWHTFPAWPEQSDMLRAAGWRYRTVLLVWVKTTRHGKLAWGMGHWSRANAEPLVLWTKGADHPRPVRRDVHQVVMAERREHSRKPDEARRRLELLFGDIRRIELYARGPVRGWDVWGNEAVANA